MTLKRGLALAPADLETLARDLRPACDAGGAVSGDNIEVQGDQRTRNAAFLRELGITVRGG